MCCVWRCKNHIPFRNCLPPVFVLNLAQPDAGCLLLLLCHLFSLCIKLNCFVVQHREWITCKPKVITITSLWHKARKAHLNNFPIFIQPFPSVFLPYFHPVILLFHPTHNVKNYSNFAFFFHFFSFPSVFLIFVTFQFRFLIFFSNFPNSSDSPEFQISDSPFFELSAASLFCTTSLSLSFHFFPLKLCKLARFFVIFVKLIVKYLWIQCF